MGAATVEGGAQRCKLLRQPAPEASELTTPLLEGLQVDGVGLGVRVPAALRQGRALGFRQQPSESRVSLNVELGFNMRPIERIETFHFCPLGDALFAPRSRSSSSRLRSIPHRYPERPPSLRTTR